MKSGFSLSKIAPVGAVLLNLIGTAYAQSPAAPLSDKGDYDAADPKAICLGHDLDLARYGTLTTYRAAMTALNINLTYTHPVLYGVTAAKGDNTVANQITLITKDTVQLFSMAFVKNEISPTGDFSSGVQAEIVSNLDGTILTELVENGEAKIKQGRMVKNVPAAPSHETMTTILHLGAAAEKCGITGINFDENARIIGGSLSLDALGVRLKRQEDPNSIGAMMRQFRKGL